LVFAGLVMAAGAPFCSAQLRVVASSSNPSLLPASAARVEWTGTAYAVTLTPMTNAGGSTTVRFSVTDGFATTPLASRFGESGLHVPLPPNTPPFIGGVVNQTVPEDSPAVTLTLNIGDSESPPAALTVSALADNSSLIPDENIAIEGTGSIRMLTIRPNADRNGKTDIDVTVSDGELSTTKSFVLTITPPVAAAEQPRLLSISRVAGSAGMKLTWSTIPGQTYQVLAKDRLEQGYWTIVSGKLNAWGPNITWTDSSAGGLSRFYVVRKLVATQPSPLLPRITSAKAGLEGEMRIEWSSHPGASYRVVAKDGLDAHFWSPVSEVLVATGATAAWTDIDAWLFPVRFYRIEWIP
jgi:hypothetical protein